MLYISDSRTGSGPNLAPLQLVLRRILVQAQAMQVAAEFMDDMANASDFLRLVDQIKYALIIVSVIPILIIYPFIQKYFVKGVMIGAIKG